MMLRTAIIVGICVVGLFLKGQSPIIPESGISYRIIDRLDILYGSEIFTSNGNFRRHEAYKLASNLFYRNESLTSLDSWDIQYLINDNNEFIPDSNAITSSFSLNYIDSTELFYTSTKSEIPNRTIKKTTRKPFLKYFYKTPANFYEVEKKDFILKVNPIIDFNLGKEDNTEDLIFRNTRGINVRAYLDDKVYLFTNILENQARFNNFHEERINRFRAIPGNGLYKNYESSISDKINGWDYLNAQAYVGVKVSKSIGIELGHGRHQIGNGIRSLLLSNHAHNYFYLKFNTQIWKFHYQNLFMELAPISDRYNPGNSLLPKKYMANHYLTLKFSDNLELGLFEAVVFSRENQFELQYLNPVILYRTVEQFLDSPDNVLIGINGRWNINNRFQLYGQFVLDEFKVGEFTSNTGWWANKYGVQAGIKYINVGGIDHLDAQVEYNTVTPYTYTHRDTLSINNDFALASYAHYNQPLAHPLGSNFREIILGLSYRPFDRLFLQSRVVIASHGDDTSSENWGGVIFTPNTTRVMDFDNELLQGEKSDISLVRFHASYMISHNYFLDLDLLYRKSDSSLERNQFNTTYLGAGIRINLGQRFVDY